MQDTGYIRDDAQRIDKFYTYAPPIVLIEGSLLDQFCNFVGNVVNVPNVTNDDNARRGRNIFVKDVVIKYIATDYQLHADGDVASDKNCTILHIYVIMRKGGSFIPITTEQEIWEPATDGGTSYSPEHMLAFPNEYYDESIKIIHDQKIVFQGNAPHRVTLDGVNYNNTEYFSEGEIRIPINAMQIYHRDTAYAVDWPDWHLEIWYKNYYFTGGQSVTSINFNTRVKFIDH